MGALIATHNCLYNKLIHVKMSTDSSSCQTIKDTYAGSSMKHFLYGSHLHDYQLFVTSAVLMHYDRRSNSRAKNNPNTKEYRDKFHSAISSSTTIYELLKNLQKEFDCESLECIYANALLAYNGDINELLIRSLNFSGRVLKLERKSDWLDNWRINAFGTCISTVMWREYDNKECYTVKRRYKPIRRNESIDYDLFATHCVGILREFIIRLGVYPNMQVPTNLSTIRLKLESERFKNMTTQKICDECYKHFVYSYIGSHGCNALIDGPESGHQWTATIRDIKTFLKRYPAMIFGGVFNTSPYGQAGQHWMSVMFHNKQVVRRLSGGQATIEIDGGVNEVIPGSTNESFDLEDYYSSTSVNNDDPLTDQMDGSLGIGCNASHKTTLQPEAILFCSQGSGWDAFMLHGPILAQLREANFPTTYNQENLQVGDSYSCGNFSIISNFLMMCNNMDIIKTASDIGRNGKNLGAIVGKDGKIDIYTMRKALFGVS